MSRKIALLSIDNQNDFMRPNGALYVPDAENTVDPIVNLIDRLIKTIGSIRSTLDSHHRFHISTPPWFKNSNGDHPDPFTLIRFNNNRIESYDPVTGDDTGEWFCSIPSTTQWTQEYLQKLAADGRYPHCIWNPHCEIGTPGHAVEENIYAAFMRWAEANYATRS